jgi:hypothetical protein
MVGFNLYLGLAAAVAAPVRAAALTYSVPAAVPAGAAELDSMPVGLS